MNNNVFGPHEVIRQWFPLVIVSLVKIIGESHHSSPIHCYSQEAIHYSAYFLFKYLILIYANNLRFSYIMLHLCKQHTIYYV